MIFAQIADAIGLVLAILVPIIVVRRSKSWAVAIPLGGFICWIALYLCGRILSAIDPMRDASVLDTIWLYAGLLPSLLYAAFLCGLNRLLLIRRDRQQF